MKTLTKTDNPDVPFVFSHNGVDIENPTISECGRFNVSPEYYGFTIWQTGGGCTAHGQEFLLDGKTVLMLVTNGNFCHVSDDDDSSEFTVGLFNSDDMDELDINWIVSR